MTVFLTCLVIVGMIILSLIAYSAGKMMGRGTPATVSDLYKKGYRNMDSFVIYKQFTSLDANGATTILILENEFDSAPLVVKIENVAFTSREIRLCNNTLEALS
jgi:hypothetical protein